MVVGPPGKFAGIEKPGAAMTGLLILFAALLLWVPGMLHGSSADSAGGSLTVVATGDIMMGTVHPVNVLPPDDGEGIFKAVSGEFRDGDIVLGNLEGPLLDHGRAFKCKGAAPGRCFEFMTPTRYSRHLKIAGFTAMNIANNHALDFGWAGAESTIARLLDVGIDAVGGEMVAYTKRKGKGIALIGFSFKPSRYAYSIHNIPEAMEIVATLKEFNHFVIVSFHGGAEGKDALHLQRGTERFLGENRGDLIGFAHSVIDAGADLVIGHGPHVVRALEVYKGKLIAYSLGNFLTYGVFNLKGPNSVSVILRAKLDERTGDFVGGRLVPVRLTNRGIPEIDPSGEAVQLVKNLTKQDVEFPEIVVEENGLLRPAEGK
ncbi:MAG: Capsule biosynthesis protein CapA [Syntrophorhabdus sp. PtaU1.Bin153]|nr:MAG: Capsule biosynthesis protein CapA [Syntrophorhabdus sp. PtaU1.Bin153]